MSGMNPAHAMHLSNLASRYQSADADGQGVLAALLLKANLISSADMQEAQELARTLKCSVDQIIRTSGYLTELQLENLVKARALLSSNIAVEDLVVTGLRISFKKNIGLEQGMKFLGWGW